MKIYTIQDGTVVAGATVEALKLAGAGISIPAVVVGETGRGRATGAVPVDPAIVPELPCRHRGAKQFYQRVVDCKCGSVYEMVDEANGVAQHWVHPDTGVEQGRLLAAGLGTTRAGKPKFVADDGDDSQVVLVFLTGTGFRGGNEHSGDRRNVPCPQRGKDGLLDYLCRDCKSLRPEETPTGTPWRHPDSGEVASYAQLPGEVIARGLTAQGDAGRMGGGEQLIMIAPVGAIVRAARSGRLYGWPGTYYHWVKDANTIVSATWEERQLADLF